jgi:hypothetical protein
MLRDAVREDCEEEEWEEEENEEKGPRAQISREQTGLTLDDEWSPIIDFIDEFIKNK